MSELETLLEYATPRQAEIVRAWIKHGTASKAAAALGTRKSAVISSVVRLRKAAARKDGALHVKSAPEGYHYRRVTTLVDKNGEMVVQWRQAARDAFDPEKFRDAVLAAIEDLPPAKPIKAPKRTADGYLNVMPIGDAHFGSLSWPEETGQAWDLKIAAEVHRRAIERLFAKAPPAEEALVVWMGDNAHADNSTNMTPRSGHILDVDSRWERMISVLFAAMCNSVYVALRRHKRVTVRIVKGNHDPHLAAALALALEAHFRHEPRVHVERSPAPLFVVVWGRVLLAFAHGHDPAPDRVPGILSADYRVEIGLTEQGYLYTGHRHNKMLSEAGGLVMEAVQTLAARDAYATHAGYRSARGLFLDTYHRDYLVATDRCAVAAQDVERAA